MKENSNNIVSVVVVTCGTNNYLKACLDSLKQQTYFPAEIIVIDNSLNPDFNQELLRFYPYIKIFSSPRNLFYSASLNKGIELSKGEYILCLNDDVILDRYFIGEALKKFSVDARIGMVSGKILRFDKKILDSTGLFLTPWRIVKERGYGEKDKCQFQKEGYIFGVNGAVGFYRKAMLEETKENNGYFDPDFRFFYEDLDISWRAQRFGWKGYYIPQALAYHVRGGSVRIQCGIDKPYARRYLKDDWHVDLIKNRYLAIIKNESFFNFLLYLPFIIFYDFIMWSYIFLFKPRLIKIFLSNLKYLKAAIKKRKYAKL